MLLVADCVGKRYGARWVLSAATLRAVPGQVRALVGRNGAGKSTLLQIACGVLLADGGTVRIGSECLGRPRLHQMARRGVFYLPEFHLLLRHVTLAEQLGIIARMSAVQDCAPVVETLHLEAFLDARPDQLSGGERRRAEVAAAVLRRPRWLLADEPLRGIAPLDAELLTKVFRDLARAGCAVVITGHEVESLFAAADQVTWCTDGTTHELGSPQAARADHQFARQYLAPPLSASAATLS
jgi:lipopolysaccharide export system ATP-binding protein